MSENIQDTQADDVEKAAAAEAVTPEPEAVTPEPEAEPEAEPETEPEDDAPVRIRAKRQWVNLRGNSLDARVGDDLIGTMGNDLRAYVGKPRAAVLASVPEAPADVVEAIRRDLADVGFHVHMGDLPSGAETSSTAALEAVYEGIAETGATGDDVAVAVGGVRALSTASFAYKSWCGGMTLARLPPSRPFSPA